MTRVAHRSTPQLRVELAAKGDRPRPDRPLARPHHRGDAATLPTLGSQPGARSDRDGVRLSRHGKQAFPLEAHPFLVADDPGSKRTASDRRCTPAPSMVNGALPTSLGEIHRDAVVVLQRLAFIGTVNSCSIRVRCFQCFADHRSNLSNDHLPAQVCVPNCLPFSSLLELCSEVARADCEGFIAALFCWNLSGAERSCRLRLRMASPRDYASIAFEDQVLNPGAQSKRQTLALPPCFDSPFDQLNKPQCHEHHHVRERLRANPDRLRELADKGNGPPW